LLSAFAAVGMSIVTFNATVRSFGSLSLSGKSMNAAYFYNGTNITGLCPTVQVNAISNQIGACVRTHTRTRNHRLYTRVRTTVCLYVDVVRAVGEHLSFDTERY
jgi:hypothetical protein